MRPYGSRADLPPEVYLVAVIALVFIVVLLWRARGTLGDPMPGPFDDSGGEGARPGEGSMSNRDRFLEAINRFRGKP